MNDASSSALSTSSPQISHDEIARRAQELWENYGRPSGRDEEIWLEAERELHTARSAAVPPDVAAVAAPSERPTGTSPALPPRTGKSSATARMPAGRRAKGQG